MKNIILFGNMYSGKSTIAAALAEMGYARISFANALKNIASIGYGRVAKNEFYPVTDDDGNISLISGRELLQRMGQIIKQVDRDFWLKCAMRDSNNYLDQPLVIDDGRFNFEFEQMKNAGWFTVGVEAPFDVRMERAQMLLGRLPTENELFHESEMEIEPIVQKADIIVSGYGDPYIKAKSIIDALAH